MASLLRKNIHEPEDIQFEEVSKAPNGNLCTSGLSCDSLPNANGPFGISFENPIPVNGSIGAFKYLNKLYAPTGPIYYHRLGGLFTNVSDKPIDAFELVTWDGDFWDILFFDVYHPRRSNKSPKNIGFAHIKPIHSEI